MGERKRLATIYSTLPPSRLINHKRNPHEKVRFVPFLVSFDARLFLCISLAVPALRQLTVASMYRLAKRYLILPRGRFTNLMAGIGVCSVHGYFFCGIPFRSVDFQHCRRDDGAPPLKPITPACSTKSKRPIFAVTLFTAPPESIQLT